MDYPRALDSSPEDRGLGVRDCISVGSLNSVPVTASCDIFFYLVPSYISILQQMFKD